MPDFYFSSPILAKTPEELAAERQALAEAPVYDPDILEITGHYADRFLSGAAQTLLGSATIQTVEGVYDYLSGESNDLLNFETDIDDLSPLSPASHSMGNNRTGIIEKLNTIDPAKWQYVLGARTYNEFLDRVLFVKRGTPEAQPAGLGYATGMVADLGAMTVGGMLAEPLALAGLGTRTTLAGRAASRVYGRYGVQTSAQAATEAVASLSRTGLAARWAALGAGEEVVYQIARQGIDPNYDPSFGEVAFNLTMSAGVAGVLGGAVFGRSFAADQVEAAAEALYQTRQVELPGGYTINYTPFPFQSAAYVDQTLLRGAEATSGAIDTAATAAKAEWDALPQELFEPPKPIRLFRGESPTTNKQSATQGGTFWTPVEELADAFGEGGTKRSIEFVPQKLLTAKTWTEAKTMLGLPQSASMDDLIAEAQKRGYDSVTFMGPDGPEFILLNPVPAVQPRVAGAGQAARRSGVPARNPVVAAAFEISLATGVQPTVQVFAAIFRAMAAAHRSGGTGFGFNSVFWTELGRELGPEVASKLRPQGARAVIGSADGRAVALAQREDLIDQTWKYFNTGRYGADPAAPQSLIFTVLEEIRTRGGTVNRQVVSEVIDELQAIAANPPTRVNAKGRTVLDPNARRAKVIEIIDRRAQDVSVGSARSQGRAAARPKKPITLPDSVLAKLGAKSAARAVSGAAGGPALSGGAGGTTPPTAGTGGNGTWGEGIPKQLTAYLTERIPLISPLLNQAARAMESDNPAVRLIASMAFNARRATGAAAKYTIFEAGSQALHASMFAFLRGYRNGYLRFASGGGVSDVTADAVGLVDNLRFAFGNKAIRQDFNRRVAKQLRSGVFDDSVAAVNDTAKGFQEIFQKVHNLAFEAGLPGFTQSAVRNYMPRLWRFDLIRDLAVSPEGTKALQDLIEQAINKNGRRVVIDGVEEVFEGDTRQAAVAFTDRLISIAKNTENRPMSSQDQELVEALGDLLGPLKAKVGSKTPFGRSRILLDESTEIVTGTDLLGNGKTSLALDDLFDDDLPKVFRKYITSVMGAVNERRLINAYNESLAANGFKGPKKVLDDGTEIQEPLKVDTIEEMFANARDTGGSIEQGAEEGLREVIAALRYEPIYSGAPKFGDRAMSLFMQYGYLTTGGQFGLAAFSEIARIVGTVGVRNTIRQLPVVMEMVTNFKNLDREGQNFASFLDSWFHPSTDRMRRVFMDPLGDASYSGPFAKTIRGATNLMSDISGLAPITSMTQQLTAAGAIQHLYEVGRGLGTKGFDDATIRTLGLEPDQYRALAAWVAENAETRAGILGDRVVNIKNMAGPKMAELKVMVDRMVRTRIQDVPTRGDFHKLAFTWWGRLVTQFSTFNLKGIDNFLIQNAGRVKGGGGLQVAKEMTATMVLAGLIGYGRNYADWWSHKKARNYEKARKMEELLSVEGFVRAAIAGPSEMYLLTKAGDGMWALGSKDPLFAPYRYSGLSMYGFPGETQLRNIGTVLNDARGALIGKPLDLDVRREFTTKTLHAGRSLIPGQNLPFLKQYLNISEQEIAEEYNLSKQQPRTSN